MTKKARALVFLAFLICIGIVVPVRAPHAFAASQSIFAPPTGFWLAPTIFNGTLYGPTNTSANWHITQWGTPAGNLPNFVNNQTSNGTESVTWNGGNSYIINQNTQTLSCGSATAPTEFDAFAEANAPSVYPGYPSATSTAPVYLTSIGSLIHTLTLTPTKYTVLDTTCPIIQTSYMTSFVLVDSVNNATLFYQVSLRDIQNRFGLPHSYWWQTGQDNTYGYTESVTSYGQSAALVDQTSYYTLDLLPKLTALITSGANGIDPVLSHWYIVGTYHGNTTWGHVDLGGVWSNFSLTATQSGATPAPTLTANGATSLTVNVGDVINYVWSSTGAASETSTYTVDSPACGQSGTGPFPWSAFTAQGTSQGTVIPCEAGHTYTLTYTVTDSAGHPVSTSVTIKVNGVAPTLTANGGTSLTVNVGDLVNYIWSAPGAVSAKSTYTVDSPVCGQSSTGPFPWSAFTTQGTSQGTVAPCQAGHTFTLTYTVTTSAGQPVSTSVTIKVNAAVPTFTANGVTNLTVGVGDTVTYAWSSPDAVGASSSYTVDSPSCGQSGTGPFPWSAFTAQGTSQGTVAPCQAGHTYVITYTTVNSTGQPTSLPVTIRVTGSVSLLLQNFLSKASTSRPVQAVASVIGAVAHAISWK